MNLGIKRIAQGEHGVGYFDLHYVRRKFLSKAALRQAITDVADAIFRIRLPHIWGEATTTVPQTQSILAPGTRTL